MAYLNREDILKAEDVQTRDVEVPEWGGTVRVRALSGYDRDAYQASMLHFEKIGRSGGQMTPELGNMTAKLIARAIIDEDGNAVFNELDVGQLGQKSAAALDRVSNVIAEISGLSDAAQETAEGNSGTGLSAGSISVSPANLG